jgi:hypothetical protein
MACLRVLNGKGDQSISWNPLDVDRGDAEAQAAVREAERIFEQARAQGAIAFRAQPGVPAQRVDTFDPYAEETIVVPAMVGG